MPDAPRLLPRFICWFAGYAVIADHPDALIHMASRHHIQAFVVWEVDHLTEEVVHLLAQREADNWLFLDGEGKLRFTVSATAPLQQWAAEFLGALHPLTAEAVPSDRWPNQGNPLYHPLGFSLPMQLGDGSWMFTWCPEIVGRHLARVDQEEREAFLEAMYARLAWWTQMAPTVPVEERDRLLDKLFLEVEDQTGWDAMNRMLVAALELRG